MQIAFGRVRRKTSPARQYVRDCYSLKCPHIFGLYYSFGIFIHFAGKIASTARSYTDMLRFRDPSYKRTK